MQRKVVYFDFKVILLSSYKADLLQDKVEGAGESWEQNKKPDSNI